MGFLLCILGRKRILFFCIFFHLHRDVLAASNPPGFHLLCSYFTTKTLRIKLPFSPYGISFKYFCLDIQNKYSYYIVNVINNFCRAQGACCEIMTIL